MYIEKYALRQSQAGCSIVWYYDGQLDHIKTRQFVDVIKKDCALLNINVSVKFPGTLGEPGRGFYISDYIWYDDHPTASFIVFRDAVNEVVTQMTKERLHALQQNRVEQKLTDTEIQSGWHWCCEFDEMLAHPSWSGCSCHSDWKINPKDDTIDDVPFD